MMQWTRVFWELLNFWISVHTLRTRPLPAFCAFYGDRLVQKVWKKTKLFSGETSVPRNCRHNIVVNQWIKKTYFKILTFEKVCYSWVGSSKVVDPVTCLLSSVLRIRIPIRIILGSWIQILVNVEAGFWTGSKWKAWLGSVSKLLDALEGHFLVFEGPNL